MHKTKNGELYGNERIFKTFFALKQKCIRFVVMKTLIERVEEVLDTLRPYLQSDGGDVQVVDIEGDVLKVKLLGNCENCNMNTMTMKAGLEQSIIKSIPEIKKVEAVV
ncbi:MAG: hypothetical protein KatS3mg035_0649 [Bacteroidia bacterium]|nr:MAG: hypothetical protein KatS3mg035_0649 [Bacteroidia bacterium]